MDQRPDTAQLLANLGAFTGFVRRRTGDGELAAEVVQEALAKALAHGAGLRDDERLLPWFWRILRNTLNDALARRGRTVALPEDVQAAPAAERSTVCACIGEALAGLPERQREALARIDLAGEDAETVAAELGLAVGNLKVIRHRARQALREQLEAICRSCAVHGCVDCHCRASEPGP